MKISGGAEPSRGAVRPCKAAQPLGPRQHTAHSKLFIARCERDRHTTPHHTAHHHTPPTHAHTHAHSPYGLPRHSVPALHRQSLRQAHSCSASQTTGHAADGSKFLTHTSTLYPKIPLGPRLFMTFSNRLGFYGEWLLAPCPTPKLDDHLLLFVRGCLFNIFACTFHCCGPSVHLQTRGRAMPW
jgi:hypothetical protein